MVRVAEIDSFEEPARCDQNRGERLRSGPFATGSERELAVLKVSGRFRQAE
jgi:hypothetical protein